MAADDHREERRDVQAIQHGQDELAAILDRISQQANAIRSLGFRIPELNSDPPATSRTNLWLLSDGRLSWRTFDGVVHRVEDLTHFRIRQLASDPAASTGIDFYLRTSDNHYRVRTSSGWADFAPTSAGSSSSGGGGNDSGTSSNPKPTKSSPTVHRQTWSPNGAASYCSIHGRENGANLYYGHYPGAHGMRRVMFAFNDSDIRSTLSGATIKKVELSARNTHSFSFGGVDIHWGAHNRGSLGSGFSEMRRNVWTGHWPRQGIGDTWRAIPGWFGRAFRDNDIKGLTIDQPEGIGYYGQIDWSSVRLRITFAK